jgi:predicted metal-dependent phosphoesterase TrpH
MPAKPETKLEVFVKIDLHVHAQERSGCATIGEESQIQTALNAGLGGLAFTDHNRLVDPRRLAELNQKYAPFRIFTGIEVDADREHWIVLGVADRLLERPGWHYPELRDFVHWRGGFIALAHPFRHAPEVHVDLDRFPPDGIELKSFNTPVKYETEIHALAERHNLVLMQNTDSHYTGQMGKYFNDFPGPIQDDKALVKMLMGMRELATIF